MLNLARLRQRILNSPRPFAFITSDGRRIDVPHEDYLTIGQGLVIITHDDRSVSVIDALHIVSLEEPAATV